MSKYLLGSNHVWKRALFASPGRHAMEHPMKKIKRFFAALLACLLFITPSSVFAAKQPEAPSIPSQRVARRLHATTSPEADFAKDRVLVKLAPVSGGGVQTSAAAEFSAQALDLGVGFSEMRLLNPSRESTLKAQSANAAQNNVFVLTLEESGSRAVERALKTLNANPLVEIAEPNFFYQLSAKPNDPMADTQWALQMLGAEQAWDITKGSKNVVVGMIDTGIEGTHPDLRDNLWVNPNPNKNGYVNDVHGFNFTGRVGGIPTDTNGHGTHVAGIIGAKGNNAQGITGLNWNVSLAWMGVSAGGNDLDVAACIEALNYANNNNIRITNNSYGGNGHSEIFKQAIQNYNGLFVVAAGNDSNDNDVNPHYPASYNLPNVISVASTNQRDILSSFSNWGKNTVHITAPGESIRSTYLNGGYELMDGTSMAAPYVAGVAALVLAKNPGFTTAQVKAAVLSGTNILPQYLDYAVSGRSLNAHRALVPWQDAQSISITPQNLTLDIGASGSLAANVLPAGAQQAVTWTSSAPGTVLVFADGTVTALRTGTATITARSLVNPNLAASVTVTVTSVNSGAIIFHDLNFKRGVIEALRWEDQMYDNYSAASNLLPADAQKLTALYVQDRQISSMEGIQYFTELETLWCYQNQLTSLDVSQCAKLTELSCARNQLTSLDVSNHPELTMLEVHTNQLTSLNVNNNTQLTNLACDSNKITSLDVSMCPDLDILWAGDNPLGSLDVTRNTKLTNLMCAGSQLTSLDVRRNIELDMLWCNVNQLTSLDVSNNPKLIDLNIADNHIASLNVSQNPKLRRLIVQENLIANLDVSAVPGLELLWMGINPLKNVHANIRGRSIRLAANGLGYVELFWMTPEYNYFHQENDYFWAEAVSVEPASFLHWSESGSSTAYPEYIDLEQGRGYDLTAHFGDKLMITTERLPEAYVGTEYSITLEADTQATWSIISGALPAGLLLAENGVISGTPTTPGDFTFTVQAKHLSNAAFATRELNLSVGGRPMITTERLPEAYLNRSYSAAIDVSGETPITWILVTGRLPAGLTLSADGVISGTPKENGSFTFTVRASNESGDATQEMMLFVRKNIFSTRHESTFWNWIIFIFLFGWIWMWL